MPPLTLPDRTISWFVFVVRLPESADRPQIQSFLAQQGIATATYFAPIHQQPAWRNRIDQASANLPITESLGARTLALPFFNRIAAIQQERVASALRNALVYQK